MIVALRAGFGVLLLHGFDCWRFVVVLIGSLVLFRFCSLFCALGLVRLVGGVLWVLVNAWC